MIRIKLFLHIILGIVLLTTCQKENQELPAQDKLTIEPDSIKLAVGESYQLIAKFNGIPLEEGISIGNPIIIK